MINLIDRGARSFENARELLENKKGAGKAKLTRIHLEYDVEFKSGIDGARILCSTLPMIINASFGHQSDMAGFSINMVKTIDNSFVQTEHEDNPDWK